MEGSRREPSTPRTVVAAGMDGPSIVETPGMDRGTFVRRVLGTGALLVAGGASLGTRSAWAKDSPTEGFQVGQLIPDLEGLDQNNQAASLRGKKSRRWTLLDACAMWCGPCQVSAAWHAQFSDYINEQGIPFHVLTVLTEDPSSGPTDQADAQSWATKFDLQDDIVMHASGDASSPLGNLAFDFGLANGQPAAYPTYALIDPSGVIRYYQLGADLNSIQAQLAAFTGVALDATWDIFGGPPPGGGGGGGSGGGTQDVLPVEVTAKRSDGVEIHETINPQGDLVGISAGLLIVGFNPGEPGFDLDTPITLRFSATPPDGSLGAYRLEASSEVSFAPEIDGGIGSWITASAQLSYEADGTLVLECPAFRAFVGADADSFLWPYLQVNVVFTETLAPAAAAQLKADVAADQQLSGATKAAAGKALDGVIKALKKPDYGKAAKDAATAANLLASSGLLGVHADSLAGNLAFLSTLGPATVQTPRARRAKRGAKVTTRGRTF